MISRPYHNDAINDISSAIQNTITVLALLTNLSLLLIVHTSHRRDIGSYRYLITFFATSDFYYTLVHWLVYPIPEMNGNAFVMRGHGLFRSRIAPCLYCAAYVQAFPILASHFVYRMLAIRSPSYLKKPSIFFAGVFVAALIGNILGFIPTFVLSSPDEESLRILAPFFAGNVSSPVVHSAETAADHIISLYWSDETFSQPRWSSLLGAVITFLVIGATYATIITCGYLINVYLKTNAISRKSLSLHRQIYRSLLYQTIYPLITTYYPLGVCVFFPVFGKSFDWVSIFCPPSCVSHPFLDPLFLIFCVSEYRQTFLGFFGFLFCMGRKKSASVSNPPLFFIRSRSNSVIDVRSPVNSARGVRSRSNSVRDLPLRNSPLPQQKHTELTCTIEL